ncbi:MAG: SCP-like extracellular [Armatimonadetes bacterium]|nr:SCP-like extracellular [Armatimonadota bacterium]
MRYRLLLLILLALSLSLVTVGQAQTGDPNGSRVTGLESLKVLQLHNDSRAEVGVEPVKWSYELAAHAQEWADHLAATGSFGHRPDDRFGENLAMGSTAEQAVGMWLAERPRYHGETITAQNFSLFGHYTQMIWRDTREIGCGKAKGPNGVIWVCSYDPGGNVIGQKPY